MKILVGIALVFVMIAMFVWNSVPRLVSDVWHRDFVPAQGYAVTGYKCTTWNLFMLNDCTVKFVSLQSGESREITDWRFGWAPRDPIQLLQRRDDASSVTTDVSLRTLWNRALVALALLGLGALVVIGLIANAAKAEGSAVGAPGSEPALEPMERSTFGKRQA